MSIGTLLAGTIGLFFPKIREGFALRLKARQNTKRLKNPIWIHVSSGEFEYAKPLIKQIKSQANPPQILVTYYSPSYRKPIEAHPLVDLALPLPLDFAGACASFLKTHKPRALLIARTDLWPEMLMQCSRFKVPKYIFSARAVKPKLFTYFSYWTYQLLDHIFCVSEEHKSNFLKLHLNKDQITACGDTRFDQVFLRLAQDNDKIKPALFETSEAPILIAGSTWPKDQNLLIPKLSHLVRAQKLKLVLVPHEPTLTHINDIKQSLKRFNLKSIKYSEAESWNNDEVLVVDQKGVLADLYKYSDLSFIGNSFDGEVHSVMEPLATGNICFVGPKHLKSPESVEFKKYAISTELNMVNVLNENNIESLIQKALLITKPEIKEQIVQKTKSHQGATLKVTEHLSHLF